MRATTSESTNLSYRESMKQARRARLLLAFLFSLIMCTSGVAAAQTTYYVDDDASSGGDCLDPTRACRTIQDAVSVSSDGDIIMIGAGAYTENVRLDGAQGHRTFHGTGSDRTFLQSPGGSAALLHVEGPGASFELYDVGFRLFSGPAIVNFSTAQMTIEGCDFDGAGSGDGIVTSNGRHVITANTFEDLETSVEVRVAYSSGPMRITDNEFFDSVVDVAVVQSIAVPGHPGNIRIGHNTFCGSTEASVFLQVADGGARVFNNLFTDGEVGVSIEGGRNRVWNNIFDGMGNHSIVTDTGDGTITHNTIVDSLGAGIRCFADDWTDTSYVANNVLLSNVVGLWWDTGCEATVDHNAAYDNLLGDIVGLDSAYDFVGNLDGVFFSLDSSYSPATSSSPLVRGAIDLRGARHDTDYYGVSRGNSPDIGAVEWTGRQREPFGIF